MVLRPRGACKPWSYVKSYTSSPCLSWACGLPAATAGPAATAATATHNVLAPRDPAALRRNHCLILWSGHVGAGPRLARIHNLCADEKGKSVGGWVTVKGRSGGTAGRSGGSQRRRLGTNTMADEVNRPWLGWKLHTGERPGACRTPTAGQSSGSRSRTHTGSSAPRIMTPDIASL